MITSISYSDTFTLAGIARLFGGTFALSDQVPPFGIQVTRDETVPPGCVVIRHSDQAPELYVLPCVPPRMAKEGA